MPPKAGHTQNYLKDSFGSLAVSRYVCDVITDCFVEHVDENELSSQQITSMSSQSSSQRHLKKATTLYTTTTIFPFELSS